MILATIIVAALGAVLAIGAMALLFWRLRRLPHARNSLPHLKISVIIPARDEAENLQKILPSLGSQTFPAHEIIVVNDQSSDDTAAIAESFGCTVISGKKLPTDWNGKPWACHQGAEIARGEHLLFLDADVTLEPGALLRLAQVSSENFRAVYSVCPWHRVEKWHEEFSVFFNVLMLGGIGAFTWKGRKAKGIGLFGQVMMLSTEIYQELGGHHTVRKTVLENFELSRRCHELGISRECFSGRGTFSMRMFAGGFCDLVSSWQKGFSRGAKLSPPLALALSSIWLSGLMMLSIGVAILLGNTLIPALIIYLSAVISLVYLFRAVGSFSAMTALLFPIPLCFYQWVFFTAILRKRSKAETQWKGRNVA